MVTNTSAKVNLNVPYRGNQPDFYKEFHAAVRPFAENLFACDMVKEIFAFIKHLIDPNRWRYSGEL